MIIHSHRMVIKITLSIMNKNYIFRKETFRKIFLEILR